MLIVTGFSLALVCGAEAVRWQNGSGYRFFSVEPKGNGTGFVSLESASTGISFTNRLSQRMVAMNRVTENGSGVALGDVDGDGWCDIYFCGLENDNVLYRNLGNWKFEDVTQQAGLAFEKQLATGAIFADVDGDGDLDLLVNSIGGGTRLFFNDGKGKFSESAGGRLVRRFGSMSMALGDIDQDGDLDLYVANYRTIVSRDEFPRLKAEARLQNGQVVVTPPGRFTALLAGGGNVELFELGERDFLYLNDGKGEFAPVSWTSGNFLNEAGAPLTSAPLDWGLSVMMRDINDDGLVDILVCNDFFKSPDQIWLQRAGLKFEAASLESIRKVSLASMAVDVADINHDGLDDLFFAEMLSRDYGFRQNHRDNLTKGAFNDRMPDPLHRREAARNTLFLNRGDETYAEVAELAGLDASEWSWGAVFLDVDLDGWEDLLVPTGHNHDVQDSDVLRKLSASNAPDSIEQRTRDLRQFPKLETPILAFRNEGRLKFKEMQEEWGLDIPGVANGFACADLDNDGDLDLVANRLNDAALLLRNESARKRIAIRLAGAGPNTRGVGAKILVRGGASGPVRRQEMMGGGRYLSCDDSVRMFACDGSEQVEVEVRWPNGTRTVVNDLAVNAVYEISQRGATPFEQKSKQSKPFFVDASERVKHRHVDPQFNDFERQPFLPYSLATQGPALAWADVDGDGWDDLIVGGARGGRMSILQNKGQSFQPMMNRLTTGLLLDDQMGILVVRGGEKEATIYRALSNYESGGSHSPAVEYASLGGNPGSVSGQNETPGALAMGDVDGDGDLDLFVTGRVVPGRYPAAASSRIHLNNDGKFEMNAEYSKAFEKIGLATSAQFSDFNEDGRADLVIALEWGTIRVFVNGPAGFVHESRGLEERRGWWTSVVTGDFNNDGLTDIVAGNWGRNTKYERFVREKPLRIWHGDVDGNGKYDVVEAIFNPRLQKYVPVAGPEMIIEHLPTATDRIPNYAAYAQAGVEVVIGSGSSQMLEINTMESMCFLNRGGSFEARALPIEAQFAPVFGIAVADFDNDGNEDLALGQNLFETRWETGRLDSGRPLWLRGDGNGGFTTMTTMESALTANGQQRAVAVADFNQDGRVDVAMSQNGGETKVFENKEGVPGVRISFQGSVSNPDAIGVRYRVVDAGAGTAVREVQAGGGWLSQNSVVQVVRRPARDARLQVMWPSGKKSAFDFPTNAREVEVSEAGIKVVKVFE